MKAHLSGGHEVPQGGCAASDVGGLSRPIVGSDALCAVLLRDFALPRGVGSSQGRVGTRTLASRRRIQRVWVAEAEMRHRGLSISTLPVGLCSEVFLWSSRDVRSHSAETVRGGVSVGRSCCAEWECVCGRSFDRLVEKREVEVEYGMRLVAQTCRHAHTQGASAMRWSNSFGRWGEVAPAWHVLLLVSFCALLLLSLLSV